jgi:hypothetical protein
VTPRSPRDRRRADSGRWSGQLHRRASALIRGDCPTGSGALETRWLLQPKRKAATQIVSTAPLRLTTATARTMPHHGIRPGAQSDRPSAAAPRSSPWRIAGETHVDDEGDEVVEDDSQNRKTSPTSHLAGYQLLRARRLIAGLPVRNSSGPGIASHCRPRQK